MKPNRLTLATVMGLVVVIALGVAGLREGTELWAAATFAVTVLILLGSLLNAAHARGPARAAWAGFALFGWSYLLWAFLPWSGSEVKAPPLLTAWLFDRLDPLIHEQPQYIPNPQFTGGFGVGLAGFVPPTILKPGTKPWTGDPSHYRQVGHCLAAVALGIVGAAWSRLAFAHYRQREGEPPGKLK